MKRVKINEGKKGLVFNNGNFVKLLNAGTHWVSPFAQVLVYEMAKSFVAPININILLQDEAFVNATTLVEVKENEIVLHYENNLFVSVLTTGRYVFWKGLVNYGFTTINLNELEVNAEFEKAILTRKEVANYIRTYVVEPNEKAVLYVNGQFSKILNAGTYYFWKNATTISVVRIDLRIAQMQIAGQEMLTKDKAALRVNFYLQYQVANIVKAIVETKDYNDQLYVLMQLALREFVGSLSLDELLSKKEEVGTFILEATATKAEALGIVIKACGIRDIILPGEMKDIMNQVLIAEKKAQANTIMRREETASTRSLLNTAKLMEENAMLFKLKEMEYVEKIAEKINSISVSGGSQIAEQLKQLFVPSK